MEVPMLTNRISVQAYSEQLAIFRARVAALFEQLPMLCGFHVTDELGITEVAICSWPGYVVGPGIKSEICAALEDLVTERGDDAIDLLRGRTFARAVH